MKSDLRTTNDVNSPSVETPSKGAEAPLIIQIKNIGIIDSAEIKLNGLTVINGANNSGKTTVGRCLYSLVSAVEDLQKNAVNDRLEYVRIPHTLFLAELMAMKKKHSKNANRRR
ncbi:MAG: ATP-binding protein [Puniceicoccales bacterium]|jgi:predicted ATP-dependent endonuclease of OLD family|nr:ATP-binding protein [Puniceicoccales bacterium]